MVPSGDRIATALQLLQDSAGEFDRVRHAVELTDGRLLALQPRAVIVIDFSAHRVDSLGREGEGPGEYLNPARVGVVRGHPVALDGPGARMIAWSTQGITRSALAGVIDPFTATIDSTGRVVGLMHTLLVAKEQPTTVNRILVAVEGTAIDTLGKVQVPGSVAAASTERYSRP